MAKWGEIKCPRCDEQDALWEGMERALEESDAREARLEAKLAKAVEALQWCATVHDSSRARTTLAELNGQDQ